VAETKTLTQNDTEIVQTTFRLPEEFLRQVKMAAAEYGTTINQMCLDGLQLRLKQLRENASPDLD